MYQQQKSEGLSFRNILEGKKTKTTSTKQAGTEPTPYIVDQLSYTPELNTDTPETDE